MHSSFIEIGTIDVIEFNGINISETYTNSLFLKKIAIIPLFFNSATHDSTMVSFTLKYISALVGIFTPKLNDFIISFNAVLKD